MKKIKFILVAIFAVAALSTQAQDAIGIRFGGGLYGGAEGSYQMGMGDANRLQLDFGVNFGKDYFSTGVTGTYQWIFNIGDIEGFNWFVGPGAQVGYWSVDEDNNDDSGIYLGIGAIGGIEYTLPTVPIQFSLDSRPMIHIFDDESFHYGAAFGVRYVF